MGNYKFRLSDMMPNAWFYKLKDMSRSKKKHPTTSSSTTTTTTTKSSQNSKKSNHSSHLRKSYYFTRDLTIPNDRFYNSPSKDPPRKSLKSRGRGRKAKSFAMRSSYPSPKLVSSTVSSSCSCRTKFNDPELTCSTLDNNSPVHEHEHELASPENDFRSDSVLPIESSFDEMVSLSSSCAPGGVSSSDKDIIINVDKNSLSRKFDNKAEEFDSLSGHELPPIITKPGKFDDDVVKDVKKKKKKKKQNKSTERSLSVKEDNIAIKDNKKDKNSPVRRRLSVSSGSPAGVRLRINSPKIANRVLQGYSRRSISSPSTGTRRSLSDSFAILKASHDPQTDFRESMVEMIVENNIRASKDLEDLLACYLSLNSDEYHDLIIKVFKQIWFDLY